MDTKEHIFPKNNLIIAWQLEELNEEYNDLLNIIDLIDTNRKYL